MIPALIAARTILLRVRERPTAVQTTRNLFAIRSSRNVESHAQRVRLMKCRSSKPAQCQRTFCEKSVSNVQNAPDTDFIPLYRFKKVQLFAALSLLKNVHGLGVIVLAPAAFIYYMSADVSATLFWSGIVTAIFSAIVLVVCSAFTRRTIGVISIHKDLKTIRVGHLTFWGRRRNVFMQVDEVVPLSDMLIKPGDVYTKVTTVTAAKNQSYFMFIGGKQAEVVNKELFLHVFHALPQPMHATSLVDKKIL